MYCSSPTSKRYILVHIVAVIATQLLIQNVLSLNTTNGYLHHKCLESQGEYESDSEYEKSLNQLIDSASNGNFQNGYNQISLGMGPRFVALMYQCRGDSYGPKCHSCYTTALSELRKRCPRKKGRIIWFEQCLVEISSISFDGKVDYDNNICMSNEKVPDRRSFTKKLMTKFLARLMSKVDKNVDKDNKRLMYATMEGMLGTKKLYGMMQCTKDLSRNACRVCLDLIVTMESRCCGVKEGGRVFSTSCNFRYEFYPFY